MLEAINSAEKSIYLELFIFDDNTSKHYDFLSALENKAKSGSKVVIVLDIVGSKYLSSKVTTRLRDAGVEVFFYSYLFRRAHRKILVVDEKVAFVGGVNIKDSMKSWKDLQIRVTGRIIIRSILGSFARVYIQCGGKDQYLKNFRYKQPIRKTRLWFVERGIGKREHLLRAQYTSHINAAKRYIIIVTPYLFPPRWLTANIHQALLRGVSVEILMPNASDHHATNMLNRFYASFFTSLGARCLFAPGMNHAKAMLIDGESGVIGSQNLDILSFEWNAEAGLFFSDPGTVRELASIINEWKKDAVIFTSEGYALHWYYFAMTFLLRIFGLLPLWNHGRLSAIETKKKLSANAAAAP